MNGMTLFFKRRHQRRASMVGVGVINDHVLGFACFCKFYNFLMASMGRKRELFNVKIDDDPLSVDVN